MDFETQITLKKFYNPKIGTIFPMRNEKCNKILVNSLNIIIQHVYWIYDEFCRYDLRKLIAKVLWENLAKDKRLEYFSKL